MECHILQDGLEFFQPGSDILLGTFRRTSQTGVADHPFGRNVDFFPRTLFTEQFEMKTLVSVFLGCIDIVGHTSRTFLEIVRQNRIDMQTGLFLFQMPFRIIDDTDVMLAVHMVQVAAYRLHFAPDTVGCTVFHFSPYRNTAFSHYLLYLVYKKCYTGFTGLTFFLKLSFQGLKFSRTTVAE